MSEVISKTKPALSPDNTTAQASDVDWNHLAGAKKKQPNKWLKLAKKHLIDKQAGRWFVGMVIVPWALATTYYTGLASERFVSETSFMVEKNDGGSQGMEGFSLLGMASQVGNDQKILEAFITSPDMMLYLDKKIGLKQHYTESADWLSRLPKDASYETFLQYYRDHLRVRYNDTNGLLELEMQGFSPEFAQTLAQNILLRSEAFVNQISHELAGEQLSFVQGEVKLSEQRLKEMTAELLAFQNETGLLSATEQGATLNGILNELQAELVRNQTELQTLTSYLNSKSPQVVALKQRIDALQQQLTTETEKLTDSSATSINDLAARQQELQLELDLATKAYSSALIALEGARTEASRKLKQLVVISSPQLSEDAKYPRVAYALTNILLILLAIFGLLRMIRATIREHRD